MQEFTIIHKHNKQHGMMVVNKKRISVSLVIICSIIIGAFIGVYLWFENLEVWTPPIKPQNVPEDAVWVGGYDGGCFVRIESEYTDTTHFVIYFDSDGEIWYDGLFSCDKSDFVSISEMDWYELLCCYNGELLLMNNPTEKKQYIVWHKVD